MLYPSFGWLDQLLITLVTSSARIYTCINLVTLFSFKEVKGMPLQSVALTFTFLPTLFLYEHFDSDSVKGALFIVLLLKECLLGLLLGLILVIPFWLFETVGAIFDNQRGVLMGEQINPALTSSSSLFGYIFKYAFLVVFIGYGGLARFAGFIWQSYTFWPVESLFLAGLGKGFSHWLSFLSATFSLILIYSAPFFVLLLLIEFCIAFLSLYSPKMQAMQIAIPIKIAVSLPLLAFCIPVLIQQGEAQLDRQEDYIRTLFDVIKLSKE